MKTDMSICNLKKAPAHIENCGLPGKYAKDFRNETYIFLQAPLGKLMSPICHAQSTKFCISSKRLFNTYKIHIMIYNIYQRSLNEGKGGKESMRWTLVIGPFCHPT